MKPGVPAWCATVALRPRLAEARLQAGQDPTPEDLTHCPCLDFSTTLNTIGFGNVRALPSDLSKGLSSLSI